MQAVLLYVFSEEDESQSCRGSGSRSKWRRTSRDRGARTPAPREAADAPAEQADDGAKSYTALEVRRNVWTYMHCCNVSCGW